MLATRVRIGRNGLPEAPWEIREEVELYAREHGRHATIHFVPFGGWFVRFSLRSDDKRLKLYQQGRTAEPPAEDVWLHVVNPNEGKPNGRGGKQGPYLPLDIYQMGAGGVREFLEKGNTWSGRGEFSSLEEAVRKAREDQRESTARFRAEQREASRHEQKDKRRWRFKIPFLPVGIQLMDENVDRKEKG